jgi:hypothetical protein
MMKMSYLFRIPGAFLFGLLVMSTTQPVMAQDVSCDEISRTACQIAAAWAERAPYQGPVRPAAIPMACVRVVSYQPVPVVWVEGNAETYDDPGARVIESTGVVYHERFALDQNLIVTESCIPRHLLNGVRELTLCTGLYEEGFHWNVHANSLRGLQTTGHSGFYHPFMLERDIDAFTPAQIRAAYRARYRI